MKIELDVSEWDEKNFFNEVVNLLAAKLEEDAQKAVGKALAKAVAARIDAVVDDAFAKALEKGIYMEREWDGSPKGDPVAIGELIVKRVGGMLEERVDRRTGAPAAASYHERNNSVLRLEYLIAKNAGSALELEVAKSIKVVIAEVKKRIEAKATKSVADGLIVALKRSL